MQTACVNSYGHTEISRCRDFTDLYLPTVKKTWMVFHAFSHWYTHAISHSMKYLSYVVRGHSTVTVRFDAKHLYVSFTKQTLICYC